MKNKILLCLFVCILGLIQCYSQKQEVVYLYDSPTKILGKAYITFITIEDSEIKQIDKFIFRYSKRKIKNIKHSVVYLSSKDFTLTKEKINYKGIIAYDKENFKTNKIYGEGLYSLLGCNFMEISNLEKIECLKDLKKEH